MYMYVNIYMDVRLGLYLSFSYNVSVCRLHPSIFFRKTMSESSFKFVGLSVLSVCLSVLWQPYCPTVLNKPIRPYNIVVVKKCLVVYRRRHNTNCAAPKTYSTPLQTKPLVRFGSKFNCVCPGGFYSISPKGLFNFHPWPKIWGVTWSRDHRPWRSKIGGNSFLQILIIFLWDLNCLKIGIFITPGVFFITKFVFSELWSFFHF